MWPTECQVRTNQAQTPATRGGADLEGQKLYPPSAPVPVGREDVWEALSSQQAEGAERRNDLPPQLVMGQRGSWVDNQDGKMETLELWLPREKYGTWGCSTKCPCQSVTTI